MTSNVISPLSPGVDGSLPHLNLTREQLKQNINIVHRSPPHNENLRNQSKHWLVLKQRRKRSDLVPLKPADFRSLKALLEMGD